MESAIGFIAEWLNSGTYGFVTDAVAYAIEAAVWAYLKFINWVIPFAWGIAKKIIEDLQISAVINAALSNFSLETIGLINFLKFPEAIMSLATAGMTKLVFKFIPGI